MPPNEVGSSGSNLASKAQTNEKSSQPLPDTQVRAKLKYNDQLRRLKLERSDISADRLPGVLKGLLGIPDDMQVEVSRFSRSANCAVPLKERQDYQSLWRAVVSNAKLYLEVKEIRPAASHTSGEHNVLVDLSPPAPDHASAVAAGGVVERDTTPPADKPAVLASSMTSSDFAGLSNEISNAIASSLSAPTFLESIRKIVREETRGPGRRHGRYCGGPPSSLNANSTDTGTAPRVYQLQVTCDGCDANISKEPFHYHCSSCNKGDFDLCDACVSTLGRRCANSEHVLIKRFSRSGKHFVNDGNLTRSRGGHWASRSSSAFTSDYICNCCLEEVQPKDILHCTSCPDYDVCVNCMKNGHESHHPAHAFAQVDKSISLSSNLLNKMQPGRGVEHSAYCDGCDCKIRGIRHKCLDCSDYDLCNNCINRKETLHPRHVLLPCYEKFPMQLRSSSVHSGVACDGPFCENSSGAIIGDRYKCAICEDFDLCHRCESLANNGHDASHPMIKIKTPQALTVDVFRNISENRSATPQQTPSIFTIANVEPARQGAEASSQSDATKPPAYESSPAIDETQLSATFLSDTIVDGTVFEPGVLFTQSWRLRNDGALAWPRGVSMQCVGGDKMSTGTVSATSLDRPVESGSEAVFNVELRAPTKECRSISFWRLITPSGVRFGHKVWCDISVRSNEAEDLMRSSSEMIFPQLPKESFFEEKTEKESVQSIPGTVSDHTRDEGNKTISESLSDFEEHGFSDDEGFEVLDTNSSHEEEGISK